MVAAPNGPRERPAASMWNGCRDSSSFSIISCALWLCRWPGGISSLPRFVWYCASRKYSTGLVISIEPSSFLRLMVMGNSSPCGFWNLPTMMLNMASRFHCGSFCCRPGKAASFQA